jgi:hypothetical protein
MSDPFQNFRKPPMPQLVVLILLVAAAAVATRVIAGAMRSRSDQTFRPRGRGWKMPESGQPGTTVLMSREQLAGLRDPFSAAPIDPRARLMRCCGCQSVYHEPSLTVLQRENRGRCVSCDGRAFEPVLVTD